MFDSPLSRRRLINLTPLIDIIFLLIVFFMLSSNFTLIESLAFNTAERDAATSQARDSADALQLRIGNGAVWIGKERIAVGAFKDRLAEIDYHAKRHVMITNDPEVSLQQMMDVVDIVKQVGVDNITLVK